MGQNISTSQQERQALELLQKGCDCVHECANLSVELLKFLRLKRSTTQEISPSSRIDALWQWMLVNTQVAPVVYEAIGGPVEHSSMDECTPIEHAIRRLRALNLLIKISAKPEIGYWSEPNCPYLKRLIPIPVSDTTFYLFAGTQETLRPVADALSADSGVIFTPEHLEICAKAYAETFPSGPFRAMARFRPKAVVVTTAHPLDDTETVGNSLLPSIRQKTGLDAAVPLCLYLGRKHLSEGTLVKDIPHETNYDFPIFTAVPGECLGSNVIQIFVKTPDFGTLTLEILTSQALKIGDQVG